MSLLTDAGVPSPTRLAVERLTGRIGAVVDGVELHGELDQAVVDEIEALLTEHKVLFFRRQHLDPATHVAFAERLGPTTAAHPTVPSLRGHERVFELDSASGARANVWHTDVTFVHRPPRASILSGVVIPAVGGDTIWANTETAYLDLPPHLRALADHAWAVHGNTADYGSLTTAGNAYTSAFHSTSFEARHPVVRVHPRSGNPSLLLGGFTRRIEGLSSTESADLVRLLQSYVTRPENTVRWRWQAGDVVMWDNQSTQHYAVDDYGAAPRKVQRVTLVGEPARSLDGRTSEQLVGDASGYVDVEGLAAQVDADRAAASIRAT